MHRHYLIANATRLPSPHWCMGGPYWDSLASQTRSKPLEVGQTQIFKWCWSQFQGARCKVRQTHVQLLNLIPELRVPLKSAYKLYSQDTNCGLLMIGVL